MTTIASPAPPARPATLQDVAARLGVHVTTVSLALRDRPGVSAAVRARIRDMAEKLGYRRDATLAALTTRRLAAHHLRPRMAFVTNHRDPAAFAETAHMRQFLAGATDQAAAMGYACELLYVGHRNLTSRALLARLDAMRCETVILGALTLPVRALPVDWSRHALVRIDTRFYEPGADVISHDQLGAVRLAFARLRALGYRRIGMAVGRYDEDATAGLYACGSLLEQADLPAASRIPALHFGYRDRVPQAVPKLAAWIRRHRVEAVIGNWSHLAGMVRAAGCRVPADVACANLCLSEPHPEMAGVWLDHHAVGRRAAEMVALNLKTGRRGVSAAPRSTYLAGKWLDGATAPAR